MTAAGGLATFNDLTIDKADSQYTLLASSSPLVSDTSASFVVEPGSLAGFTVEDFAGGPIPAQNAGVAFRVRISARDAAGNVAKSFTGTVSVTANGGGILGAGGGTTLAFTNGILASHTVSFNNTGASFSPRRRIHPALQERVIRSRCPRALRVRSRSSSSRRTLSQVWGSLPPSPFSCRTHWETTFPRPVCKLSWS